jgi:hypothetical protein
LGVEPTEGPAQTAILVHALELPPGFPPLDSPTLDGGYTKLREDVEVTGYFLKRVAYYARDGMNTAPLVLTHAPRWFPSNDLASTRAALPSRSTFLTWVAGAALLGIVIAVVAYRRSRAASPALESLHHSPAAQRELADSLTNAQAGPTVEESLRAMAEEAKRREADNARSS